MTVTVCIPAYRSGGIIAETVGAVLTQTHADLKVIVSIDPPDDGSPDDTAAALAGLAADRRLTVRSNPRRLGWAENVNAMVPRIATPWFCFLPHDDIWSPRYLEVMLAALEARPDAIIAYCDILRFGASPPVRKSVTLTPGADRPTALLDFLLQGTEAQMWRGVTRSSVLDRVAGFPTDGHKGLVVECEYALALLGVGAAVHVPRTHYFKRIYTSGVVSASRERMLQPPADRRAGWNEHDRRMQALLVSALDDMRAGDADRALCHAAKEAALLRRFQQFVGPRLGPAELARAEAALQWCGSSSSAAAGRIAAGLHLVLAGHWAAADQTASAEASTRAGWEAAETYASVLAHAQALRRGNRPLDALERAAEAMRIGHLDDTQAASRLIAEIYADLGWTAPR